MDYKHLNPKVKEILFLSKKERIEFVQRDKWINYPVACDVLNELKNFVDFPRCHRMPSILIIGETNNGKSMILNRFEELNKPYLIEDEDFLKIPVLKIQAPPIPDEKRLYDSILNKLKIPHKASGIINLKKDQAMNALHKVGVKVLIIDEIHHILAGHFNKQRQFLNVIKYISNELEISIVGAGIKEALQVINADPQLANRFIPFKIPKWSINEDYFRLLASVESILPLPMPSNLHENNIARHILQYTEGTIGEISNFLKATTIFCINNDLKSINTKIFQEIKWVRPSERKEISAHL